MADWLAEFEATSGTPSTSTSASGSLDLEADSFLGLGALVRRFDIVFFVLVVVVGFSC